MENVLESWAEIAITVKTEDIETAGNIANMVVPYGIYIEDYSALEEDAAEISHYDFIDDSLLHKDRTKGIIHIYINPHENPLEAVSFITERLNSENIEHEIKTAACKTEDWVNNWKQYFHAMPIGKKLLIRPLWEKEYDTDGRIVLNIEPGLAFGTGSHPTTKLCLETLEKYIDEVKTAIEDAKENGFGSPVFDAVNGNLSDKVSGKYNVIVANIVADIIMQFNEEVSEFLEDGGIYITGGIIDIRKDEVVRSFEQNGFEIIANYEEKGWNVFVCRRR